jgi:hypothetical protein
MTSYVQQLQASPDLFQTAIEDVLSQFRVLPVGSGYIDLIVSVRNVRQLIDQLALLPVAVASVSWWCHCTPESRARLGCPHGLGGPQALDGRGWFSECVHYPDVNLRTQDAIPNAETAAPHVVADAYRHTWHDYFDHQFPHEPFYSPCLWPGLWLYVPDEWQRKWYRI